MSYLTEYSLLSMSDLYKNSKYKDTYVYEILNDINKLYRKLFQDKAPYLYNKYNVEENCKYAVHLYTSVYDSYDYVIMLGLLRNNTMEELCDIENESTLSITNSDAICNIVNQELKRVEISKNLGINSSYNKREFYIQGITTTEYVDDTESIYTIVQNLVDKDIQNIKGLYSRGNKVIMNKIKNEFIKYTSGNISCNDVDEIVSSVGYKTKTEIYPKLTKNSVNIEMHDGTKFGVGITSRTKLVGDIHGISYSHVSTYILFSDEESTINNEEFSNELKPIFDEIIQDFYSGKSKTHHVTNNNTEYSTITLKRVNKNHRPIRSIKHRKKKTLEVN